MKNGLFKRYFLIFSLTLIVSTLMLGIALLYFSALNFTSEKEGMLYNAAQKYIDLSSTATTNTDADGYVYNKPKLERLLTAISDSSGATLTVCNAAGKVVACSELDTCHHTGLSQETLNKTVKRGEYSSAGYFEGFFRNRGDYTFGMPIFSNGVAVGFIFASASIMPLFSFLADLLITFLISSGVMLIGAIVIVYFSTRALTAPLHQMSAAAKSFGSGDFSARVTVEGDDEIAGLAKSFNNMAVSLSENEQIRRSFVANVSHDLRTPMTTIGGYIDGILDGTIKSEQQEHYLKIVSEEVKRLSRLTRTLLSVSRLEEGNQKPKLESCDAWDIIINVMLNVEQRIGEKQIYVPDFDVKPCYVMCDRDMFHQCIYNLIDNAIKFTPELGMISVRVTPGEKVTEIAVQNTGAGISAGELSHLFERFYKTDKSRSLDKTGTGLGLYIVKRLVCSMEGDIAAESDSENTFFKVTLKTGAADKSKKENIRKERIAAVTIPKGALQKQGFFERISGSFDKKTKKPGTAKKH